MAELFVFLISVTKHLRNPAKAGRAYHMAHSLKVQFITVETAWQQVCRAAGHFCSQEAENDGQ